MSRITITTTIQGLGFRGLGFRGSVWLSLGLIGDIMTIISISLGLRGYYEYTIVQGLGV